MAQVIQTPEQQLYLARLLGYDYTIHYRVGRSNAAADALSRRSETHFGQLFLLTVPNFLFLQELKRELLHNTNFLEFRRCIQANPQEYPDYTISHDFILPKGLQAISTILAEFHSTPTGGHMGIAKTLA